MMIIAPRGPGSAALRSFIRRGLGSCYSGCHHSMIAGTGGVPKFGMPGFPSPILFDRVLPVGLSSNGAGERAPRSSAGRQDSEMMAVGWDGRAAFAELGLSNA
eukprot:681583-Hanusia_phi.AAC.1